MTEETAVKLNDFIESFKNVIKESEKAMRQLPTPEGAGL